MVRASVPHGGVLMGLTVVKIAVVVLLLVGACILVVTFIRKSRAKGFPTPESDSQFWQSKGAMPPTPKPDWADAGDDREDGNRRKSR